MNKTKNTHIRDFVHFPCRRLSLIKIFDFPDFPRNFLDFFGSLTDQHRKIEERDQLELLSAWKSTKLFENPKNF